MLKAAIERCGVLVLFLIACDQAPRDAPPYEPQVPHYVTEIMLSGNVKLRNTSGATVQVDEGLPGEADGKAQISLEAKDSSVSAAFTATVLASDILENSWEALRVPHGSPVFSLTVNRSGEETNTDSGVIRFQRDGKTISGSAEVQPESNSLTFSGPFELTCWKLDPAEAGQHIADPTFESEFCQRFSAMASEGAPN